MTQGVSGMTQGVSGMTQGVSGMTQGVSGMTQGVSGMKKEDPKDPLFSIYPHSRHSAVVRVQQEQFFSTRAGA
jgi:hypothetical protein